MNRKTWWVRPDEEVLYPETLKSNPDKYGGMGVHMANAIRSGVITIPLQDNDPATNPGAWGCVSIQVTDTDAANRIIKDGKVDIVSDRAYWYSILDTTPVFHGTDEPIPLWGKDVADSLEAAGVL